MKPRHSRRRFLAAAASTGLAAQSPPPVTIDCQNHLFVPELIAFMEKRKRSPHVYRRDGETFIAVKDWVRRLMPKHTDVKAKLADMDGAGIEMTALSINDPGPELFGSDGPAIARMVHDFIADVARKHPRRFFGLMTLPLQDVGASLQDAERCVNKLGMKGILLYSNIHGEFPDTLVKRARGLGLDFGQHISSGHMAVQQLDPAELSPGDFIHQIRDAVLTRHLHVLVIDSLNGFLNPMPGEQLLTVHCTSYFRSSTNTAL
jgi:hypothetical protein